MGPAVIGCGRVTGVVLFSLLSILYVTQSEAQISPGPLSSAHSSLDGSDQCLKCHSQKKRISAERCLDCHELLREQLDLSQGFHATVVDQGCERCHMDHHGLDFELVYWGEEGEEAFDHGQTSFVLRGSHRQLACRGCHKEALIRPKEKFRGQGKDLNRTFLGLDGSQCVACHLDEHREQFSDRGCESCHGLEKWTEGLQFEHQETRYPLVGKHSLVACGRCHSRVSIADAEGDDASFVRFAGIPFANCTDCHRDPHDRRLGSNCQQCHTESGWKSVQVDTFDHGRTRFDLLGAHRKTKCESCHRKGLTAPLARFQNCTDCHADHHLGQFASRSLGAQCDSCHDLEGFRPAQFALTTHQESRYPLQGAHLAVACDACHIPLDPGEIRRRVQPSAARSGASGGSVIRRYDFPATQCTVCHENLHEESLARFMLEKDCLTCHQISGWRQIEFDHERTDYSLFGGHQRATCLECHRIGDAEAASVQLQFDGISEACVACHDDPHIGQFAKDDRPTLCASCHSSESWKRLHFDHGRDASYALDGVHARVECAGCHPTQSLGGRLFVRYRPLGQECRDCHSGR